MAVLPGVAHHLGDFRLGDIAGVDRRDGLSLLVHGQHDVKGFSLAFVKKTPQDLNHVFHRRVVVVVKYNVVTLRNCGLLPLLDLDILFPSGW